MGAGEKEAVSRRFIGLAAAAARAEVSVQTVRRWLAAGGLRGFRPGGGGGKILLEIEELDDWILRSAKR